MGGTLKTESLLDSTRQIRIYLQRKNFGLSPNPNSLLPFLSQPPGASIGFHRQKTPNQLITLFSSQFLNNTSSREPRSKIIGDFVVFISSRWFSVRILLFSWFCSGSIIGRILRSKIIGDFVVFLLCFKRVDFQSDFSCFCGSTLDLRFIYHQLLFWFGVVTPW